MLNNPIFKAIALLAFLMLGFFVGSKAFGDNHPKPVSVVEFGISKHGGLHYVNGGFGVEFMKYERFSEGVYTNVNAIVNINSLWTWQGDASKSDDPKRTKDLLSDDWFDAKKFPKAYAKIHWLPVNNADNVAVELKIKGIKKLIMAKVRDGKLLFRVNLGDFNLNASWKRIFAGNFADVSVNLGK